MIFREAERIRKAIQLLKAVAYGDASPPQQEVVVPLPGQTIQADLYEPPQAHPNQPALLLCHGMTKNGRREPRVIQLARGFSEIGFRVLVPTFPKAEQLQLDLSMVKEIEASVLFLHAETDRKPRRLAIFGISFGGTMALLAAARPSLHLHVDSVATLGAFHSLPDLLAYSFTGTYPLGGQTFPIPPAPSVADHFRARFPGAEKLRHDPEGFLKDHRDSLAPYSLASSLPFSSRTRFILLHARSDKIVPWKEMPAIASMLRKKGHPVRTHLVDMAEHARVATWYRNLPLLWAARSLVSMLEPD